MSTTLSLPSSATRSSSLLPDAVIPFRTHTSFYDHDHLSLRLSDTPNLIPSTTTLSSPTVILTSTTPLFGNYHQHSAPPITPSFDNNYLLLLLLSPYIQFVLIPLNNYSHQSLSTAVSTNNIHQYHPISPVTPYFCYCNIFSWNTSSNKRHNIISVSPNTPIQSNPHHARTQTINNIPNTPSPSYSYISFLSSFTSVSQHVIHCYHFTTFTTFCDTTTTRRHTSDTIPPPLSSSLPD